MPYETLDTRLIHAGELRPRVRGAVAMPVFQSATFAWRGADDEDALRYIRYNNTPNHDVLHAKLAALEGGEAALVTASGMAAISGALLAMLGQGDHLIAQDTLYGGTAALVEHDLPRMGIDVDLVDGRDPETWAAKLRPNTKVFYTEALSNPLVQVTDHEAVVAFARAHDLTTIIDATFATPVNFEPLTLGYDVAVHSATKYLNGHSDIVAGAVVGDHARVNEIGRLAKHLGGTLDPHACFLLHRGLKTLGLRVGRQNDTALRLATALEALPEVERVHYPGLASHPDHHRARQLFAGCGGVLAFDLRSVDAVLRLEERLQLPVVAPSLGGVETLVSRPMLTSHAALSPAQRAALGIRDETVRVAVGIEDAGELVADFEQAIQFS